MWSDNVGWFNANGTGGTVAINPTDGNFSGYAWSDSVGWLNFAPGGTNPDGGAGKVSVPISAGKPSGSVTGWARACSVFASGCAGTFKSSDQLGGWDGWVKMINVSLASNGKFSGFAWGDLNVGWSDLSGLTAGDVSQYKLSVFRNSTDTTGVSSIIPVNINSSAYYSPGAVATLMANVATCWALDGATVAGEASKKTSYSLVMNSDHVVTAGCGSSGDGTVTGGGTGDVAGNPCAGVTISGLGTYPKGAQISLSAFKGSDVIMGDWSSTPNTSLCTTVTKSTGCTFTMPDPAENVSVNISNCAVATGENNIIVKIKTGVGYGIKLVKDGGLYPAITMPFKLETSGGTANNLKVEFDWSSLPTGSDCVIPTIIDSSSNTVSYLSAGSSYRLRFSQRCTNTSQGSSRYNGTWSIPLKIINGGVDVSAGQTTKLDYNDTTIRQK
jgi:hypothetical protein